MYQLKSVLLQLFQHRRVICNVSRIVCCWMNCCSFRIFCCVSVKQTKSNESIFSKSEYVTWKKPGHRKNQLKQVICFTSWATLFALPVFWFTLKNRLKRVVYFWNWVTLVNTYVLTQRSSSGHLFQEVGYIACAVCFDSPRKNQLKRVISIESLATLICFKSVKRTSSYLFMNWTSLVALNVCSSMQTVRKAQYKDDSCHYLAVYFVLLHILKLLQCGNVAECKMQLQ